MASYEFSNNMRADVLQMLQRLQSIVNFQLASALQLSLDLFLSPFEQVGVILLLCLCLHVATLGWNTNVTVPRSILIVQMGQSVLRILSFAQGWTTGGMSRVAIMFLANTFALCLPSLLSVLNPKFAATDYVRNAVTVYLFKYATTSRELLAIVDFGVSPFFFSVLALVVSFHLKSFVDLGNAREIFQYVFQALHMLLIDWLLQTVVADAVSLPLLLQVALMLMIVIFMDKLRLADSHVDVLKDVRSYTVWRVAGQLQRLSMLFTDSTSSLAAAVMVHCARGLMNILCVHTRVVDSLSEIVSMACINVLVQNASDVSEDLQNDTEVQVLRVFLLCMFCHWVQTLLE
jgi:hypothetical protein